MIADAYVILRYGHGAVSLTGWGLLWLMVVASCVAGSTTNHITTARAERRARRATSASAPTTSNVADPARTRASEGGSE